MKTIVFSGPRQRRKDNLLHIETEFGIVNIWIGLTDINGNSVTSIEIIPDNYCGEPKVRIDGTRNVRLIQETKPIMWPDRQNV